MNKKLFKHREKFLSLLSDIFDAESDELQREAVMFTIGEVRERFAREEAERDYDRKAIRSQKGKKQKAKATSYGKKWGRKLKKAKRKSGSMCKKEYQGWLCVNRKGHKGAHVTSEGLKWGRGIRTTKTRHSKDQPAAHKAAHESVTM